MPHEQRPNPYVTREPSLEFHDFVMRKLQTGKIERPVPVVLYGKGYWKEVINFDALVRHRMTAPRDLALFRFADDPAIAHSRRSRR